VVWPLDDVLHALQQAAYAKLRFVGRFNGSPVFSYLHQVRRAVRSQRRRRFLLPPRALQYRCGQKREVAFNELSELHVAYLKGLGGPYSLVTAKHDDEVYAAFTGEPIDEAEYHAGINRFAGSCRYGGEYQLEAWTRCPKCGSTDYNLDGPVMIYD